MNEPRQPKYKFGTKIIIPVEISIMETLKIKQDVDCFICDIRCNAGNDNYHFYYDIVKHLPGAYSSSPILMSVNECDIEETVTDLKCKKIKKYYAQSDDD